MNEIYTTEIGEVVSSTDQYVELLTLIHNELVELNSIMEVIQSTSNFTAAILAGCFAGAACAYFIGKLLRTR